MDMMMRDRRLERGLGRRVWAAVCWSVILAWGAAGVAGARPQASGADRPPNVVLIMTDDQGWGDVGIHGNKQLDTPHLDRLARDGVRLNHFYVSPVCAPTRASLLTGRYHERTGVFGVTRGEENMYTDEVTLAEVFKAAGYATGCFGKWHNGSNWPHHPNAQGFDEFIGFCGGHWNNYFDTELEHNGKTFRSSGYITDVITGAATRFIATNKDKPFFCYVPYNAPHSPWQVPDKFYDKYKQRGLDNTLACAFGMVENIDHNVGVLLKQLDDLGVADNTIVIFITDNGPNTDRYNGNMRGRKGSPDEGGVRVPCFIRWPKGIKGGRVVESITSHIDLLPTLRTLCGIDPKQTQTKPLDGIDVSPLVLGEKVDADWPNRTIFNRWRTRGSVRTQRWRATPTKGGVPGQGWKLYDMQADPGQTKDVAVQHPDVLKKLRNAYVENTTDVNRMRGRDKPVWVGHEKWPTTELRGHEAHLRPVKGKGISYVGRSGWANDWITNWTDKSAHAVWPVKVVREGNYRVSLLYTCPPKAVGSAVYIGASYASAEPDVSIFPTTKKVKVNEAYDPKHVPSPDRVPRKEVYEKVWRTLNLGQIKLLQGEAGIHLRAAAMPNGRAIDVKAVRIEWVGP